MMPFLNFLAPLLGSALGGIGTIGTTLGTGLSGLGNIAGGLLSKLPILGKGGLGLGQTVTDITGGLGGLFNRGGNLFNRGSSLLNKGGIGKQGLLFKLFGNQEAPATNNPNAVDPFADTTRVDEQGNLYNSQSLNNQQGMELTGMPADVFDAPPASVAAEAFKVNPPATQSGFQQPMPATADPSVLDQAVKVSQVMGALNNSGGQPYPTGVPAAPIAPIQAPRLS